MPTHSKDEGEVAPPAVPVRSRIYPRGLRSVVVVICVVAAIVFIVIALLGRRGS